MTALTPRLLAAPLLLLPLATLSCADVPHEPPQAVTETRELLCLESIRCGNGECDLSRSVRSEAECTRRRHPQRCDPRGPASLAPIR